ncbi:MAG: DUF4198 domain-containing protein [Bacteroidota bacterium]
MMRRFLFGLFAVLLLSSHDMYLKLDEYFLKPSSDAVIQLLNGTFYRSENVINRDRMIDVSLVTNGIRTAMDTSAWFEEDNITYLDIFTAAPGTGVVGVSTKPRNLAMSAEDFNGYLEHDGVLDMLDSRTQRGVLDQPANERYSKHVKTIFQVGNRLTDDYKTELGYPIEFLLQENPYGMHAGHDLRVQLVFQQQPLPNQLVYVGYKAASGHDHDGHSHDHEGEHTHEDGTTHSHGDEDEHSHDDAGHSHDDQGEHTHEEGTTHSHDEEEDHTHDEMIQLRTDPQGFVDVPISGAGIWYLRTIHLVEIAEEDVTHESNWATVTFAVVEDDSHDHDHHDHGDHDHEAHSHEEGIPGYVYGMLSILIVAGLFFWFNRKK